MNSASFDEIQKALSLFSVGIAGAGGLGSNCAAALVRSGIGKLVIADFDEVSISNLNRQFYFYHQIGMQKVHALKANLMAIGTQTYIDVYDIKLNENNIPTIFATCDVVVEAFDAAEMKQMLIETVLQKIQNVPIVVGSGMAGWGNSNAIRMEQHDNIYVCGDQENAVSTVLPPLAPRVGMVANMQANQVLELLLKR